MVKARAYETGNGDEVIQLAIADFSKSRMYRNDSVFSVSFHDSVYRMHLEKLSDGNYRWVNGELCEGITAVRIGASRYRFLLTASTKVGSKGELPARFVEKQGKLIYWWDDDYALTDEALRVFMKYKLLQDDDGGRITFIDNLTDDTQKAAHYYFCQSNVAKFKKVITAKGLGYYDPPKLTCSPR